MEALFSNVLNLQWQQVVMWGIGALLIYLAIARDMEPTLLLPLGFGAILVNLPFSGAVTQVINGVTEHGALSVLFDAGIANELFPLLLFIGIGAMIDFGPLLSNPKLHDLRRGRAVWHLLHLCARPPCSLISTTPLPSPSSARPTAPPPSPWRKSCGSKYLGAIMVSAYSYMALVPVIQPPVIRLLTTKKERMIRMPYHEHNVSKITRILFPILTTVVAGLVAPASVALVGFLMFGNLIRECGVLDSLSDTAQHVLANLITILLGITIACQMKAEQFLRPDTLLILGLGLVAFIMDTAGGVLFAKLLNLFLKEKINPMIGAAGISAFPMSGRIVHKMGLKEDPSQFPADALHRRQRIRSDRLGHRRRPDPQLLPALKEALPCRSIFMRSRKTCATWAWACWASSPSSACWCCRYICCG